MTTAAVSLPTPTAEPDLKIKNVLRDTWSLYRRLFVRSVGLSLLILAGVELVRTGAALTPSIPPLTAALVGAALSFVGTSLVQGALAENVRDVHIGAKPVGIRESYNRAAARIGSLVGVSILSAIGITIGLVLLLVPGLVLVARWALAVPVVMYEGATPLTALRRSTELVRGHGRAVFTVIVNVGVRVVVVAFVFGFIAGTIGGFVVVWIGTTIGGALTTPYAAHALSVLYYRLTEPDRPLIPEPGSHWNSVWHEQAAHETAKPATEQAESLLDEQQRRFVERAKQWGA
jgi:hypothetical protein